MDSNQIREFLTRECSSFESVNLKNLDSIQLLNRIDSKYIFHFNSIQNLLKSLKTHYPLLEIGTHRVFRYETNYYDTPKMFLYHMHHSGRTDRLKVRTRKYVDTGSTFFEVKYKTKINRTLKERIPIENNDNLSSDNLLFNRVKWGRHTPDLLQYKLSVNFFRITLAGFNPPERITLDFDIQFNDGTLQYSLPELVIAEVKQDKSNIFSPFLQELKKYHLEKVGFSKYSVGVALLDKNVKHNAFKPNLIKISKILGQPDILKAS